MITGKRLFYLFVSLTVALLAACEPLAPELTPPPPSLTPAAAGQAAGPSTFVVITDTPGAEQGIGLNMPAATAPGSVGGAVNTPIPTLTPTSEATAFPTTTPVVCNQKTGQLIESSFASTIIGDDVPFLMYQPPCFFDTLKRYPYVILLHGSSYDETMWPDLGVVDTLDQGIASGALPPMVLIMPAGGELAELNDQAEGQSFEDVILDELIPALEAEFCLWGSRQGRAIGGISRGGFWAFSMALRHPDLFSILGGHSPHFDADNTPPNVNPLDLAGTVNLDRYPMRIYMDNGADDYVGQNAIRMSELLRANGIVHTYLVNPTGDHDEAYWRSHVAEYLSFYGQTWPRDPNALPSCLEPSPK